MVELQLEIIPSGAQSARAERLQRSEKEAFKASYLFPCFELVEKPKEIVRYYH